MARQKVYNLRLSDEEWERLKSYADSKQVTPAEIIRDYIKRLPRHSSPDQSGVIGAS